MQDDDTPGRMTHVEISKGLVALNALSSVLTRLVSVGALLWVNQYLLRRLSPEQYAPYPVVAAAVVFVQMFTAVLTGSIARYVTEGYAKGDPRRVTEVVSSMVPQIAIAVLVFLTLGGLASWKVGWFLTIHPEQLLEAQLMMSLLILNQGVVVLAMPFSVGLYVRQRFVWLNLIQLGQSLLKLSLLFILLFGVSTQVLWVVVSSVVPAMLGTAVTVLISRRLIPELRFDRSAFRWATARRLTSFGAWTMIGELVWRIRTSSDLIILNKLATAADVNAFHIGMIPDRQVEGLTSAASSTLQPALTSMHATNKQGGLRRAYLRGNRYYLWATLAVAVPLLVFPRELVSLYVGESYILAGTVAMIMYGYYPLRWASEMLYRVALATARVRGYFTVSMIAGLSKVAISILLVGKFQMGALGAALSTLVVGTFFQLGFFWPMGLRMLDLPFRRYLRETLLPGWAPAGVAAVTCYVVKSSLPATSWLALGVDVAVGLLVYGLVLLAFLRPEDRTDLARLLRHIESILRRAD